MERAYETCVELCEQRGYEIIEQDDDRILANKKCGNQICIFLANNHKFNIERIEEYIVMMRKMDVWHCIIVYKDNATPVAKKFVSDSTEMQIELFNEDELQYNLTKHYLVPLHELYEFKSKKEYDVFKKKFGEKLPVILKTDPVSRFYGFKKGDIIKITRKDGYVAFRIVK